MEGVNHVHVVEVGRSGFVGDVDGVFERQVPNGEGLELRIASTYAPFVLVVELREAGGHLAAAGAWGRDDDEGTCGLDVVVLAKAFVRGDEGDVVRIAVDEVVDVGGDAHAFQTAAELVGRALVVVVGDDDRADHEVALHELVAQTEHVLVVGDAEVGTHLVAFDVVGADDDDDFQLVAQLAEHAQFGVGQKSGQHTCGVVVVEEFAAQFEVEFAVELGYALADVLRLYAQVFVVVETDIHDSINK